MGGVLVLMFEQSRSYLTPPVNGEIFHGENCRARHAFRGFPGAVSSQLRTGVDKGNPTVKDNRGSDILFLVVRIFGRCLAPRLATSDPARPILQGTNFRRNPNLEKLFRGRILLSCARLFFFSKSPIAYTSVSP